MCSPGVQMRFIHKDMSSLGRLHCLECEPCFAELWIRTLIEGACKHQVWSKWLMRLCKVWQFWGQSSTWHCYPSSGALQTCQPMKTYVSYNSYFNLKNLNPKSWPFFMHFQHPLLKTWKPIPWSLFFHYFFNFNLFWMPWLSPTTLNIITLGSGWCCKVCHRLSQCNVAQSRLHCFKST